MQLISKVFSKSVVGIGLGIMSLLLIPQIGVSQSEEDILNSIGNELDGESAKKKESARIDKEYKALKSKADGAYQAKRYGKAKEYYDQMVKLKPDSEYASNRLLLMDEKISAAKAAEAEKKYAGVIKQADVLLAGEKWTEATAKYNEALALSPSEAYPKQQIAKVSKLKEAAEAAKRAAVTQKKYDEILSSAEKALTAKNWDVAKQKFNEAAEIKPSESYPREKAAMITKLKTEAIAKAKKIKLDKEYTATIATADQSFATKNFQKAITDYEAAKALKPGETYPTEQIAKSNERIAILAENKRKAEQLETDYQKQKKLGEDAMSQKNWLVAIESFSSALALKPANTNMTSLLNQAKSGKRSADELALKEKANEEARVKTQKQFDSEMAKANAAITSKNWAEAELSLKKAKSLKPDESLPDTELANVAQLKKQEQETLAAAAEAEKVRLAEEVRLAKEKEDEENARLAEEKRIAEEAAAAAESSRLAAEAAEKARLEEEKRIAAEEKAAEEARIAEEARVAAQNAELAEQERLQAEAEAKRIAQEEAQLAAELAEKEKQKLATEAAAAAALASQLAAQEEIKKQEEARIKQEAELAAAASEANAKKLAANQEKERLALEEEQNKKGFNKAVADYKEAIQTSAWDLALRAIGSAQAIFPSHNEIAKMQSELTSLQKAETDAENKEKLREQKALAVDQNYQAALKTGDDLLGQKKYAESKKAYANAIKIKPVEDYPKNQIEAIKRLELAENAEALEAQQKKDQEFQDYMSQGQKALTEKNWMSAKTNFSNASAIKPEDNRAQKKLAEVTQLEQAEIASAEASKELDEDYLERMSNGQNSLDNENFADAKRFFFGAAKLKPNEDLPKQKLEETESLWAAQVKREKEEASAKKVAQANANYSGFVNSGDKALEMELWDDAIQSYQGAIALKPEEAYPKQKLNEAKEAKSRAFAAAESDRKELELAAMMAEKERLKAEMEAQKLDKDEADFNNAMNRGSSAMASENYDAAVKSFKMALTLKPGNEMAAQQLNTAKQKFSETEATRKADAAERKKLAGIELEKRKVVAKANREAYLAELNKNSPAELAKKYPDGITEEIESESEMVVTKSIIVENNEGRYLIRFDYPWGEHFYYLDGKKIREDAYNWNVRKYKF